VNQRLLEPHRTGQSEHARDATIGSSDKHRQ